MTIHVYNTPTALDHLVKDISTVISPNPAGWSGAVRGEISIEHPVIEVEAQITVGNYCYIPDFGRYYWIVDKNVIRRELTELTLKSDPLMSFADSIKACKIIASRSGQQGDLYGSPGFNSYLSDPMHPIVQTTTSMDLRGQNGAEASLGVLSGGAYTWNQNPILVTVG